MMGPSVSFTNLQTILYRVLLGAMLLGSRLWTNAFTTVASGRSGGFYGAAATLSVAPISASARTNSQALASQKPTTSPPEVEVQSTTSRDKKSKNNHRFDDSSLEEDFTPWNHPSLSERTKTSKAFRSRQHVNPLSSKFQQPTVLSKDWPRDVFQDLASRPLFLDIGCSRGGFLLDIATQRPNDYNYLGLEIRPVVVHHAKDRVSKRPHVQGHLDFVGCNANVDLDRLLTVLTKAREADAKEDAQSGLQGQHCDLQMVCVQFPDPHFKARHSKRRVVTPELVKTLARFMPSGGTVFLQSDIQSVLDEMRLQFRDQSQYFADSFESLEEYLEDNVLGIPTEREVSVLEKGLPVYRSLFTRTDEAAKV
ncbi:MAG: hypothetical protein SGILL_007889 [Bacillariaceae sp.]